MKIPDIVGMITRKKGTVKRLLHKYSNWCLHTEKETIVGRKYLKKEQWNKKLEAFANLQIKYLSSSLYFTKKWFRGRFIPRNLQIFKGFFLHEKSCKRSCSQAFQRVVLMEYPKLTIQFRVKENDHFCEDLSLKFVPESLY